MAQVKLKTSKTKAKGSKAKVQTVSATEQAEALIPQMIEHKSKVATASAALKEAQEPLTALEAQFLNLVDTDHTPDDSVTLSDGNDAIKAGACVKTRMIADIEEAILALEDVKEGLALEVATFRLTDLAKYLTDDVIETFTQPKIGNRRLTYNPK